MLQVQLRVAELPADLGIRSVVSANYSLGLLLLLLLLLFSLPTSLSTSVAAYLISTPPAR